MSRSRPRPALLALLTALIAGVLALRRYGTRSRRYPEAAGAEVTLSGLAPDGRGVVVVANANAGNRLAPAPAERLREQLPGIQILEAEEGEDLPRLLRRAARRAQVLGVAGGDGSVGAAAEVAHEAGLPLLITAAGTLNHLARDLGIQELDATVAAVRQGHAIRMDLGVIDGRTFVNAASVGIYPALVASRERLEQRLGKWPAALWCTANILVRQRPIPLEIDGQLRVVWLLFFGNGSYRRGGLAPSRRTRLDDGVLDVRLVHAELRWARLRLVTSVLTGRLGRCRSYETWTAAAVHVRSPHGPVTLARDGEVWSGPAEFRVSNCPHALTVLRPHEASRQSSHPAR